MTEKTKTSSTVPLDWGEVYYTNCPLVSASNVDQELGWTKEEYKKIGVRFAYFRSRRENNWYPHYVHNLDNLIRFGGLFPPIHVHADIRRTRLYIRPVLLRIGLTGHEQYIMRELARIQIAPVRP